jgi:hypothetical protein
MKDLFLHYFFILSVMILECVVVKSYRDILQLHQKQKVHNHNILDYDISYTLCCKVHLWLNINIFWVILLDLGGLQYKFQFIISFLLYFSNACELYATRFD